MKIERYLGFYLFFTEKGDSFSFNKVIQDGDCIDLHLDRYYIDSLYGKEKDFVLDYFRKSGYELARSVGL